MKLSAIDRITRDYLYDKRGGTASVSDITAHVARVLGTTVSAGAVRKALTAMPQAIHLGRGSWTWNTASYPAAPVGHTPRPALPAPKNISSPAPKKTTVAQKGPATMTTPTAASSSSATANQARMRQLIEERLKEYTTPAPKPPAPKPATTRTPRKKKGIKRPSGETYYSRELAGQTDVDVLRKLRDNSIYVLLSGPPGTGKTALAEAAFGTELHTVSANENTDVDDFLGRWSPDGNNGWTWAEGPLVKAMKAGGVLLIDDATLAGPKALAVVYPAMDGRRKITIPAHYVNGKPEEVEAKPGFFVVAAHNPGVHGAILTDALASRFTFHLWVETDLDLAGSLGVPANFIRLVTKLRDDKDENLWVPQLRELLAARDIAKALDEATAAGNLLAHVPDEDRKPIADKMRIIFGTDIKPVELGVQL